MWLRHQLLAISMRIATWNVNSVKAHLDSVTQWLEEEKPDVLALQELKCEDHAFPTEHFSNMGYTAYIHGQKTYNGVALLSRIPIENIQRGLPGDESDEQARFILGTAIDGGLAVNIASLYLPNGNPAPGPKYDYKLAWMHRLRDFTKDFLKNEEPLVLAGDYNVIAAPIDARNPQNWIADALYLPQSRAAFAELLNLGLTESFRALHPTSTEYSFWDYQAGAWPKNNGIRIDHLLLSPQAADKLQTARIFKDARGHDKPSDHVPVMIELI
jgi:exodeoxyribonuclease III